MPRSAFNSLIHIFKHEHAYAAMWGSSFNSEGLDESTLSMPHNLNMKTFTDTALSFLDKEEKHVCLAMSTYIDAKNREKLCFLYVHGPKEDMQHFFDLLDSDPSWFDSDITFYVKEES